GGGSRDRIRRHRPRHGHRNAHGRPPRRHVPRDAAKDRNRRERSHGAAVPRARDAPGGISPCGARRPDRRRIGGRSDPRGRLAFPGQMTIGDETFAAPVLQKVEVPKLCGRIPYAQTAEYLNRDPSSVAKAWRGWSRAGGRYFVFSPPDSTFSGVVLKIPSPPRTAEVADLVGERSRSGRLRAPGPLAADCLVR